MSLSGECITPPEASHISPSRVTPANINICFSFRAAEALYLEGVKREEAPSVANWAFKQDIIVTKRAWSEVYIYLFIFSNGERRTDIKGKGFLNEWRTSVIGWRSARQLPTCVFLSSRVLRREHITTRRSRGAVESTLGSKRRRSESQLKGPIWRADMQSTKHGKTSQVASHNCLLMNLRINMISVLTQ